jgi:hypothetical protein
MSATPVTGGAPRGNRRKILWAILTLILATGGFALFTTGNPVSAALAPSPGHVTVHPALLWTPLTISAFGASPNPAFLNSVTTVSVTASGGQPPYTYNYTGLPPGCSAGNVSSFSCTPTTVGNYTIILKLSDAGGNATRNAIGLRTVGMTITSFTDSPASISLGSSVTFTSNYAGALGAVTWVWSNLPAGCLSVNASSLTCTPTVAGTFVVKLWGNDSTGAYNSKTVTLTVTPVSITGFTDSPSSIHTGQSTTFTTTTTGTISWVTYTYVGLPPGSSTCLSQNKSSWTCIPREAGTFTVRVYANDSAHDSATRTVTLTVAGLAITAFTAAPTPSYELLATTFTVTAVGYLGPVVGGVPQTPYAIYSYTGLPTGCASANVSRLVCKATEVGTFTVTANVSDPTGNYTTKTLAITIYPAVLPDFYVVVNSAIQTQTQPIGGEYCQTTNNSPFWQSTCSPQAQDPSLLSLPNNMTGLAYTLYTTATTNTCYAGASADTVARVMFALSSNNGTSFGTPVNLGPTTCPYLDAIEPSFASNGAGDVFGVFIMDNNSSAPSAYGIRSADELGFVSSSDGGVSFSAVSTISVAGTANLARPAIAVIGDTIYLVYENIANGTKALPGTPSSNLPISVEFTTSSNGGGSWSTPVALPGLNATNGYNAMSPSIAVSAKGEIAVAYATDRSCVNWVGHPYSSGCLNYGSEVVAVTSTNNGTKWSGPSVASMGIPEDPVTGTSGSFLGETTCDTGTCQAYFFQSTPETAVAFSPNGGMLIVAWAGTVNNTVTLSPGLQWRWTAVGVSGTSNNGTSWTGGVVESTNAVTTTTLTGNRSNYYRPAIGVEGSELYLTFSQDNETNTTSGIGAKYPGPFDNSLSQWGDEASLAIGSSGLTMTWGVAAPMQLESIPAGRVTNFTANSFTGFTSSVNFNSYGQPLLAYTIAQLPVSTVVSRPDYYAANTTYGTSLVVGALAEAGMTEVTTVSITEAGLNPGTVWSLTMDGQLVSSNGTSLLVANVPLGVTIYQKLLPASLGNLWGEQITQPTLAKTATYFGPGTITLSYSVLLYYNQSTEPGMQFGVSSYPNCNPSSAYCYQYYFPEFYIYECIPVPGYTCTTAPATSTYYGSTCGYTYQVGCYFLELFGENYSEVGPNGYQYYYEYTEEYLYTYTTSQGYHEVPLSPNGWLYNYCYHYSTGSPPTWPVACSSWSSAAGGSTLCNATSPLSARGATCAVNYWPGIWLPGGFHITAGYGIGDFYTDLVSSFTEYGDYYNGTGNGAYNGTYSDTCINLTTCPIPYYGYYYYGVYYPFLCSENEQQFYTECTGSAEPVVMNGPINETVWQIPVSPPGTSPGFPLDVVPKGLPSGAMYSFDLAGIDYSGVAPTPVLIDSVQIGLAQITDAEANVTTVPGWEYFAAPVTVPIPATVIVNLTFSSYVDLAAPTRTVTLEAGNLTTGVAWAVEFNGSQYEASTPSIDVSAHPGYYGITSWAVNSSDGQTRFVPTNPAKNVNLTTATKYSLPFTPWYRTVVSSSNGGNIQIGSGKPGSSFSAYYPTGQTLTLTATPASGYEFLGFSGTGLGSYNGNGTAAGSSYTATITVNAPIQEGVAFELAPAARFNVTFVSTGLPAGVWWTVFLDGNGYSSNQPSLTVTGLYSKASPFGTYSLSVNPAYEVVNGVNGTQFIPGGYPLTLPVNSTGPTLVSIIWTTKYLVTIAATNGGSVLGSVGSTPLGPGAYWEPAGQAINITATPTPATPTSLGYRFVGWDGTGNGSTTGTSKSITFWANATVTEVAQFVIRPYSPPRQYIVTFTESAFPSGTPWSLTVQNKTETWKFSSDTKSLNATGLANGTAYTLTVATVYASGGEVRYVPQANATFAVAGKNYSHPITFQPQFWVSVKASSYGSATVTTGSSNAAAQLSGWYAGGTKLNLQANASGTAVFVGWTGTGSGSYNGSASSTTLTVVNGPINEVAQFQPVAPPNVQQAGFLGTTPGWGVLAAVGLAAGFGVGFLLMSRRRGRPASQEDSGATEEQEQGYGSEDLTEQGRLSSAAGGPEGGGPAGEESGGGFGPGEDQ